MYVKQQPSVCVCAGCDMWVTCNSAILPGLLLL